ncbi:hypothetical protein BaRGS_00036963, partial [Batillaria attramentaria]
ESDEPRWKEVKTKKTRKKEGNEAKESQPAPLSRPVQIGLSADQCLVKQLLNKSPDNTLIFRRTSLDYDRDALLFTKDVVSLWNTPHRNRAHILLGIRRRSVLPHDLVGLPDARDDDYYQSLFRRELFQLPPRFTYREVMYMERRVGIVQIESNQGCGFPSVVISDDVAPGLQKDQLWARKEGQNALISPSDLLVGKIHVWFQAVNRPSHIAQSHESAQQSNPPEELSCSAPGQNTSQSPVIPSSGKTATKTSLGTKAIAGTRTRMGTKANELLEALGYFQKGHFVLLCGTMRHFCRNVESLASAPWIAVYDFDFRGRDPTGLLSSLEENLRQRRGLHVYTWRDPHIGITERGTQWWSLRGRRDVSDSATSDSSHVDWFKKVREKLDKLCIELASFSEDYTIVTILVLWPYSELEARCMHRFLLRMQDQEQFQPQIILCFTDSKPEDGESMEVQMIRRDFGDSVKMFYVSLNDFCTQLELYMQTVRPQAAFEYQLPSEHPNKMTTITDKDAAWLAEDLDVLYLQSPYTKRALSAEDLRKEADNFFRGGTINWYAWYDMGSGYLDAERSISKDVTKHIREVYVEDCKNGMVTILHAPGSGGTTMSQRILWDLHTVAPCVQVRQRSGSSMEDIADRLIFLHDRSHLPVVALMDGEDEPRLQQLSKHLERSYVIILYVKRYPYHMDESRLNRVTDSKYYLRGEVKKQESRNLVMRFREPCQGDQHKIDALMKLDADVQGDIEKHQMYEYGMTVYDHEFKGVRAYVRGYLRLGKGQRKLEPWQRCLGFLSLVYYYGQSSLPCQFFAGLLGMPPNSKLDFEDFPYEVKVFVVPDTSEGRGQYVRIAHYIIAKEILEQILNRGCDSSTQKTSDRLSRDARRNLKDFAIEFINEAVKKKTRTSLTAQTITYILAKAFIFRDNREISDIETQETHTKKPQFSQIMSDLDSDPPYSGRLEVLTKLSDAFPDDPNFRAHLGRFYTCCRPEDVEEAERHFKDAIKLCKKRTGRKESEEVEEKLKLTMMHIYHMYGMFFQVRIARYLKSNPECGVAQNIDEDRFTTMLNHIVVDADQACQNFVNCRLSTPSGCEKSYTYINEIHVRLEVCDFVNRCYPGGLQAFLSQRYSGLIYTFLKNSITEIEDLIMECYNVVILDNVIHLQRKVQWFEDLFSNCTAEMVFVSEEDELTSLRRSITAKKLAFRVSDKHEARVSDIVSVECSVSSEEISSLVSMLEMVFEYESISRNTPKRKLELDYKDWILAIRNPKFPKVYSLENVLRRVRNWSESVNSPQSTFYTFVLLSLLGFGTSTVPGSTESLLEAQQLLLDKLHKLRKTVLKSRFPREWLGKDDLEGIRRLVSSSTVGSIENRRVKNAASRSKLAVCKGTIRTKNMRLSGYIDLDLGEQNTSVKVFYIPLFAKLEGSRFQGERVQFYLAFTLENGYEAYEVKLLDRYRCSECHRKVEMTWDQQEVTCPCGALIFQNEYNQVPRAASDEELSSCG